MRQASIGQSIQEAQRKLAVLIDPDKADDAWLQSIVALAEETEVGYFFVGGSLLTSGVLGRTLDRLKKLTKIPLVIFPGSFSQVHESADAILFLSLISGRNPELLIGEQVKAAPFVKKAGLEVLPTGYMLIDGGRTTTAGYISGTIPLPNNKPEIAGVTAMAGSMLGLQYMYLDGGSGAENHVHADLVRAVRKSCDAPIICGGGVSTSGQATSLFEAGANLVVVGTAIESNPELLREISLACK